MHSRSHSAGPLEAPWESLQWRGSQAFSAVIPTYNRARTLGRAIRSALAQRLPPKEIVVVDDGSSDGTRELVDHYGDFVRYHFQPNAGVAVARNVGASLARSEWLAFLDSDDYWNPLHLSNLSNAIAETDAAAACYFADTKLMGDSEGRTYWDLCSFEMKGAFCLSLAPAEWAFLRIQPMLLQASAIRRASFFELGGLPPEMLTREDTLLFFRLAFRFPICAVRGCGTVMMNDGGARLTEVFDERHSRFQDATIALYDRILQDGRFPKRVHRSLIRTRLADALLTSSVAALRDGSVSSSAQRLWQSFRASPVHAAFGVLGKISGVLSRAAVGGQYDRNGQQQKF